MLVFCVWGCFALKLHCCFVCCYVAGRVCFCVSACCCAVCVLFVTKLFCVFNAVLFVFVRVLCVTVLRDGLFVCFCWLLGCCCVL